MRIGISGHQRLRDPARWDWVRPEMRDVVASVPQPVIGITCLAVGADTIFAEVILELRGSVEVVVPFSEYEQRFLEGHDRQHYQRLLDRASKVQVLQKHGTDEEAYFAAGKRVVDLASLLILVWDGKPAAGLGGTADIALYARASQKTIIHLNPDTRTVTR